MKQPKNSMEVSASLTPELEGAPTSLCHEKRMISVMTPVPSSPENRKEDPPCQL